MNENRKINKLRNVALATILAAGVVGPTYVATAETTSSASTTASSSSSTATTSTDSSIDSLLNSIKSNNSDSSTTPSKEETVYVFANADGSVKNTIVSDWLKNVNKSTKIQDVSNLTDIQNTESNAGFTTSGNTLSWDANGSDIYYQGNTTQQAPVTVKVTYTLDGKTVSPSEIAGKSGKVKIRFDYTNNSTTQATIDGTTQTIYTPFVAMTGLILSNDNFSNVEVTNGKSMNDGDRTEIAGYAMPGMQSNLNLSKDKIDIPDYVEITADATNFKLDTTATVVTNSIFNNVDTSDIDSSTVQSSMDKLSSAMTQLIDGSSDLYDGLQQLADGTTTLDSGVGTLQDKTASLPESSNKLAAGSASLAKGLLSALDGTSQLKDGAAQLEGGLIQMRDGTKTETGLKDALTAIGASNDATKSTLLGGTNLLNTGLENLRSQFDTGCATLATKVDNQLVAGIDTAISSIGNDNDTSGTLLGGANTVSSKIGEAQTATSKAGDDVKSAGEDLATAGSDLNTVYNNSAVQQALANDANAAKAFADAKAQLTNAGNSATDAGTQLQTAGTAEFVAKTVLDGGRIPGVGDVAGVIPGLKALRGAAPTTTTAPTGLYAAKYGLMSLSSQFKDSAAGTAAVDLSMKSKVDAGITQLESGVSDLKTGLEVLGYGSNGNPINAKGQTSAGIQGAIDGLGDENTKDTLIYGADQLCDGAGRLDTGVNAASTGANQIAAGTQQLADATPALVSGIQALKSGSSQLASGTSTARDGSLTLADGLKQFNDEGVSKIVDAYNNNLKGLSSRVSAMTSASKNYDTFSGKSSTMSGTVKFIYETDSIGD